MRESTSTVFGALILLLCTTLFTVNLTAQHCPYDGGSMLVIKLTDSKNKVIGNAAGMLSLVEIDNPNAPSCKYAEGMLVKAFLPPLDAFMLRYKNQGEEAFRTYCENCSFTKEGYYAVVLNQAENVCMITKPDGSDYERYAPRKFEIRYSNGGKEQTMKAPDERIYSMCLGTGEWSRFVPVEFKLDASMR